MFVLQPGMESWLEDRGITGHSPHLKTAPCFFRGAGRAVACSPPKLHGTTHTCGNVNGENNISLTSAPALPGPALPGSLLPTGSAALQSPPGRDGPTSWVAEVSGGLTEAGCSDRTW